MATALAISKAPKLRIGDKIRISRQVSIDKANKYILSVGESYTAESVSPTGAVRITKTFPSGETRKAIVSKAFYAKA